MKMKGTKSTNKRLNSKTIDRMFLSELESDFGFVPRISKEVLTLAKSTKKIKLEIKTIIKKTKPFPKNFQLNLSPNPLNIFFVFIFIFTSLNLNLYFYSIYKIAGYISICHLYFIILNKTKPHKNIII